MADKPEKMKTITLEELTISNMHEIQALVHVLERKGILTKAEVLEEIAEITPKPPQRH